MPRFVVPIASLPRRRSLAWSIARCHGMIRCALPESRTRSVATPREPRSSSSSINTCGLMTHPAPITHSLPWRIPEGMCFSLYVSPSTTRVWPAFGPPLLVALVDEVVDPVARPARPVLGPEVVEDHEVVAARVRRRLAVAEAFAQRVEPTRDVEEERGRPGLAVAPDHLAEDRHRQVRLARTGVAAEEEPLAQVGARAELLRPLPADGERIARVGHWLEVLERAVVVGRGNSHPRPALVGSPLLVD